MRVIFSEVAKNQKFLLEFRDFSEYGLTLDDYVRPEHNEVPWFDLNHVNYNGALKVTSKIAERISRDLF